MSAAFFGAFQPMHLQITRGGWRLPSKTSHSPLSSPFASKNRRCSMLAGVPYVACLVIIDGREHKTVTFRRSFWLKGVDRLLPPADYRVVTDEELIEGRFRLTIAYRRQFSCLRHLDPRSRW